MTCFGWTWYLANDMQMFLILPWMVLLYKRSPLVANITMALFYITNFVVTFVVSYHYKMGAWSIYFNENITTFF